MTRVLVVEDEESFSDALSFMLRREGYEVGVASDGTTAGLSTARASRMAWTSSRRASGPECRQIKSNSRAQDVGVSAIVGLLHHLARLAAAVASARVQGDGAEIVGVGEAARRPDLRPVVLE